MRYLAFVALVTLVGFAFPEPQPWRPCRVCLEVLGGADSCSFFITYCVSPENGMSRNLPPIDTLKGDSP